MQGIRTELTEQHRTFTRLLRAGPGLGTEPSMTAPELSQKYSEHVPSPATAGSVTNGARQHKYYIVYSVFVLYVQ